MLAWMVLSIIRPCPNGYFFILLGWFGLPYLCKSLTDAWSLTVNYSKFNVLPSAAPGSAKPARNIVALFSRDVFTGHKLNNTSLVQLTLVNIILGEPELNCLSPAKSLARVIASAKFPFQSQSLYRSEEVSPLLFQTMPKVFFFFCKTMYITYAQVWSRWLQVAYVASWVPAQWMCNIDVSVFLEIPCIFVVPLKVLYKIKRLSCLTKSAVYLEIDTLIVPLFYLHTWPDKSQNQGHWAPVW